MKNLGVDEIVPWPFLNLSRSTDPCSQIWLSKLDNGVCVWYLGQCVCILYLVWAHLLCQCFGIWYLVWPHLQCQCFGIWYGLISSVRHKNFSWLVEVLYPTPPSPILTQSSISSLLSFSNICLFLLYTLPTNLLRPIGQYPWEY